MSRHKMFVFLLLFWHHHVLLLADTHVYSEGGGVAVLPLRTQVVSMKHATSVVTDNNNVIFGIKDILKLKMMPVVLD